MLPDPPNSRGRGSGAAPSNALRRLPSIDAAIALWVCALDARDVESRPPERILSPAELARAERFGTELLRARWIAGRATVRLVLGRHLGIDPAELPLKRGIRGRPELDMADAPDFNVSHTGNVALIGIGVSLPRGERIGVDIERTDRPVNADRLARKFLTERERAALATLDSDARRQQFLRLWTCKEAMSKATGDALSAPYRLIDVALDGGLRLRAGPAPYTPERWRLFPAAAPNEFIATVAVWRKE